MAKCGSCDKAILQAKIKPMEAREPYKNTALPALAMCCPHCDVVLSVQFDPVALREDLLTALRKRR